LLVFHTFFNCFMYIWLPSDPGWPDGGRPEQGAHGRKHPPDQGQGGDRVGSARQKTSTGPGARRWPRSGKHPPDQRQGGDRVGTCLMRSARHLEYTILWFVYDIIYFVILYLTCNDYNKNKCIFWKTMFRNGYCSCFRLLLSHCKTGIIDVNVNKSHNNVSVFQIDIVEKC